MYKKMFILEKLPLNMPRNISIFLYKYMYCFHRFTT